MIIRKPYAFLIKHFRLVHGILFGLLIYLIGSSFGVYNFFSQYAQLGFFYDQANLSSHYVSFMMFIASILATIFAFIIYYILSIKQKDNKIYLWIFLFYIVLFIYLIYMKGIFTSLETKSLKVESVRVIRDISFILLVPQVIFIFITLSRTLGFNLKQFEFKKDLEEMEIDSSDAEEVELNFGNNGYKVKRFFRKLLRLSKYFVLENKMFVIGTASVIVLGISISFYNKIDIYSVSYNETQNIVIAGVQYNVNESYITTSDMNNVIINEGKIYILVNIKISNITNGEVTFDRDSFKLLVDNELVLPTFSLSNKFNDIGDPFKPTEIKGGVDKNYIVIYELNEDKLKNEYIFKIKGLNEYKDVIIRPTNLNNSIDEGTFSLPSKIELNKSMLKNSTLVISSYEIADKFKEKFKVTVGNKEEEFIYSILPQNRNGKISLIKIKSNINIDKDVYINKHINIPADFFDYYGIIRYRYMGNYKTVKLEKVNVDYEKDNYAYLEIPSEVEQANKIDLIILIRGVKYTINLK